jgi:hypothetical protein
VYARHGAGTHAHAPLQPCLAIPTKRVIVVKISVLTGKGRGKYHRIIELKDIDLKMIWLANTRLVFLIEDA